MEAHVHLRECFKTLAELKKFKDRIDPASGIRISIGRSEEPDIELQPGYPDIKVGTSNGMIKIVDAVIAAQEENLKTWIRFTMRDIKDSKKALEDIDVDISEL